MLLSIIICTYNRSSLLTNCLTPLIKQVKSYSGSTEVIVVDNNSTDDTKSVVEGLANNLVWLSYVKETVQGLSHARNKGAIHAKGKYLCYLDDDAMPGKDYVKSVHMMIAEHLPDFAGGPVYPYYTTPKPNWFHDEFEVRRHSKKSGFMSNVSLSGGNYIVRASVLKSLGYFSPDYGMVGDKTRLGEEKELLMRYRSSMPIESQKVYYAQSCYIYHHVPKFKMSIIYMWKRHFFAGRSLVRIKDPNLNTPIKVSKEASIIFFRDVLPLIFVSRTGDSLIKATNRFVLRLGKLSVHLTDVLQKSKSS